MSIEDDIRKLERDVDNLDYDVRKIRDDCNGVSDELSSVKNLVGSRADEIWDFIREIQETQKAILSRLSKVEVKLSNG